MAPVSRARRLYDNLVVRAAVYYTLLYLVGASALRWLQRELIGTAVVGEQIPQPISVTGTMPLQTAPATTADPALAWTVLLAMLGAVAVALPVAWLFILTRQKRGYQQSVVQLLVTLPPLVAGIVVMVKFSLALAFSLAGIVAAVRFRSTLEDAKDAVYAFLAIGIGIAAAVDLRVAFVMSLAFNGIILALWYTDFGRAPAHLEGHMAKRRLEKAMQAVSRTGTFVARLDQELFEHMSPEQLEAAAERVRRRQSAEKGVEGDAVSRERTLRIRTNEPERTRSTVETMLSGRTKGWRLAHTVRDPDGWSRLEYAITLRKRDSADDFTADIRKLIPDVEEIKIS